VALDNLLRRALTMALVIPIRLYRLFLSPLVGPACRFSPSCSEYAIEALHSHGPIKGTMLAAQRLSRCHPISWLGGSSGFDPVPPVR
jgi:putative membrane protein insertion efficiency factor